MLTNKYEKANLFVLKSFIFNIVYHTNVKIKIQNSL